jgi:hypothetical protein
MLEDSSRNERPATDHPDEAIEAILASEQKYSRELQSDGILCVQCASISWPDLMSKRRPEVLVCSTIDELDQSQCRLCRFLGHFVRLRGHLIVGTHQIIPGDICKEIGESLSYLDGEALPVRIFISDSEPYQTHSEIREFFPRKLDFSLIKSWINSCEIRHGTKCAPVQCSLSNLQVIDCARRIVVVAPAQCQYVALSYVWGPNTQPLANKFDLSQILPETIEDSIRLTQALGYRYLWVDRYVHKISLHDVSRD